MVRLDLAGDLGFDGQESGLRLHAATGADSDRQRPADPGDDPDLHYGIYPLVGRFCKVTPLRKMSAGFFVAASSFLIVGWIEARIQHGLRVSVWWQILAYVVLSAAEVLVSITGLEFSYKQAPLRMKSLIMALFLLAVSLGNAMTASVNNLMVRDLPGSSVSTGPRPG